MGTEHVERDHGLDFFVRGQSIDEGLDRRSPARLPKIDDVPLHPQIILDISCVFKQNESASSALFGENPVGESRERVFTIYQKLGAFDNLLLLVGQRR
jgi:hypothetical protein